MTSKNKNKITTLEEFRKHYYYATELKKLAKKLGIKNISKLRKDELEKIIEKHLSSGKIPKIKKQPSPNLPKDSDSKLTPDTVIRRYTNDKKTKDFLNSQAKLKDPGFRKKSGNSYRLNRWREEQTAKGKKITYGDLAEQYIFLNSQENKSLRIASARYINFMSDFMKNETCRSRPEALKVWKELKTMPVEKDYASWKKYSMEKRASR